MIPLPRPGLPPGACQECGRQHIGDCLLGPRDLRDWYLLHLGVSGLKQPEERTATEALRRLEAEEILLRSWGRPVTKVVIEPRWGTP